MSRATGSGRLYRGLRLVCVCQLARLHQRVAVNTDMVTDVNTRLSPKIHVVIILSLVLIASAYASDPIRILAIGDSLIAGYGLKPEEGFTAQLEKALNDKDYTVQIVNSGISGDTTSGGLARIDWVLSDPYSAVILNLGNNDAFRAVPVDLVKQNLIDILERIQSRKLPILLAGAKAPRNLGPEYSEAFDTIYPEIARHFDVLFYPFFLEGVATDASLNQQDGIHPNKAGVSLIVIQMLPYVEKLISQAELASVVSEN